MSPTGQKSMSFWLGAGCPSLFGDYHITHFGFFLFLGNKGSHHFYFCVIKWLIQAYTYMYQYTAIPGGCGVGHRHSDLMRGGHRHSDLRRGGHRHSDLVCVVGTDILTSCVVGMDALCWAQTF